MINNHSTNNVDEIEVVFSLLNIKPHGCISLTDTLLGLSVFDINLTEPQLTQILTDVFKTTNVNESVFIELVKQLQSSLDPSLKLHKFFKFLDKSNKGFITCEDLKHAVRQFDLDLTDDQIVKMFSYADQQKQGYISFDNFCDALCLYECPTV